MDKSDDEVQTHIRIHIKRNIWNAFGMLSSFRGTPKQELVVEAVTEFVEKHSKELSKIKVK